MWCPWAVVDIHLQKNSRFYVQKSFFCNGGRISYTPPIGFLEYSAWASAEYRQYSARLRPSQIFDVGRSLVCAMRRIYQHHPFVVIVMLKLIRDKDSWQKVPKICTINLRSKSKVRVNATQMYRIIKSCYFTETSREKSSQFAADFSRITKQLGALSHFTGANLKLRAQLVFDHNYN